MQLAVVAQPRRRPPRTPSRREASSKRASCTAAQMLERLDWPNDLSSRPPAPLLASRAGNLLPGRIVPLLLQAPSEHQLVQLRDPGTHLHLPSLTRSTRRTRRILWPTRPHVVSGESTEPLLFRNSQHSALTVPTHCETSDLAVSRCLALTVAPLNLWLAPPRAMMSGPIFPPTALLDSR